MARTGIGVVEGVRGESKEIAVPQSDVQYIISHIQSLLHKLNEYSVALKAHKPSEYLEVSQYIIKHIDYMFLKITQSNIQEIVKRVDESEKDYSFIDAMLLPRNRGDLIATASSPLHLQARYAAFLLYDLYDKLNKISENVKTISISRIALPSIESEFSKISSWADEMLALLMKADLIDGLQEAHVMAKDVAVTHRKLEHSEQKFPVNKSYDKFWHKDISDSEKIIKLFKYYLPLTMNIFSKKHEVEKAKEIIKGINDLAKKDTSIIYEFLKEKEVEFKGNIINPQGEFSRIFKYVIERLEFENFHLKELNTNTPSVMPLPLS